MVALSYLINKQKSITVNLGTGQGTSVKDLVDTFAKVTGLKVPYQVETRRAGDVAICFAHTGLAERELTWKAKLNLEQMCEDAWRWQLHNPDGY